MDLLKAFPIGARCKIAGLTSTGGQKFNGTKCTVMSLAHDDNNLPTGRITIRVDGQQAAINIKAANLHETTRKNKKSRRARKESTHMRAMTLVRQILTTDPGSARMATTAGERRTTIISKRQAKIQQLLASRSGLSAIHQGFMGSLDMDDLQFNVEGHTWSPRLVHLYELRKVGVGEFGDCLEQGRLARKWFPDINESEETSTLVQLLVRSLCDGLECFVRSNRQDSNWPADKVVQPCEAEVSLHIMKELVSGQFDTSEKVRNFVCSYLFSSSSSSKKKTSMHSSLLSHLCMGVRPHVSPKEYGCLTFSGMNRTFAMPKPGRMFGPSCYESVTVHSTAINVVTSIAMQSAARQIHLGRARVRNTYT